MCIISIQCSASACYCCNAVATVQKCVACVCATYVLCTWNEWRVQGWAAMTWRFALFNFWRANCSKAGSVASSKTPDSASTCTTAYAASATPASALPTSPHHCPPTALLQLGCFGCPAAVDEVACIQPFASTAPRVKRAPFSRDHVPAGQWTSPCRGHFWAAVQGQLPCWTLPPPYCCRISGGLISWVF